MKMLTVMIILLSGCATHQPEPQRISGSIDSFTDYEIDRTMPVYFSTEGQNASERQITASCKLAAYESGLIVSESKSNSYVIKVIGAVVGEENGPSMTFVAPGTPMAMTDTIHFTKREIKISLSNPREHKDELLSATIRSSGSNQSIVPVAYEMCIGFFSEYPTDRQAKVFSVISDETK